MWWCPCARWCCPPDQNRSEIVLLTGSPLSAPQAYTVRRISSFGQTIINDKGEEEEVGRHGSILAEQLKEKKLPLSVWSSAPSPVQPGVTKSDVLQQLNKMPPISESKNKWKKINPSEKKRDTPFTKSKYRTPPSPASFESESVKSVDSFDGDSTDSAVFNSAGQKPLFPPAAISASTPNLLCDGTKPVKGPSTPVTLKKKSNWAKSQSLMDVRKRVDGGGGRFSEVLEDSEEEVVMDSGAAQAARYGLDMSLYRGELRRGSVLPPCHPQPTLTITAHFSLDKMLVVEVVGVGGLGGCGPDRRESEVVVKLSLAPGKHAPSAATSPAPPSANLSQHFSLPVSTEHNLLRLSVFDSEWLTCEHDAIGHALLELSRVSNLPTPLTLTLSKRTTLEESAGLVQVTFEFHENHLSILVKGISNLSPSLSKCKLYCKLGYYHDGHKAEEKVSKVVTATYDTAVFNFAVKIRRQPTDRHSYLVIGVKRRENRALRRNPTVGRAYLGPAWWTGPGPKALPTPWGQGHLGQACPSLSLKLYL